MLAMAWKSPVWFLPQKGVATLYTSRLAWRLLGVEADRKIVGDLERERERGFGGIGPLMSNTSSDDPVGDDSAWFLANELELGSVVLEARVVDTAHGAG